MMSRLFEDFASPDTSVSEPPTPEALPGYADGYAAGEAAARAQQNKIEAEFVAQLEDMAFGFAEAQQALLAALSPFVSALVEKLLPDTIEDRFNAGLTATMIEAATHDLGQPIALHVHPSQAEAARLLVSTHALTGFAIRSDPALSAHAALVSVGGEETALDIDGLTEALTQALRNLTFTEQRETQNG